MKLSVVWLLAFASTWVTAAQEGCLRDALTQLIQDNALVSQTDHSLKREGLVRGKIFGGGGLCGPTCANYIFDGVDEAVGRPVVGHKSPLAAELKDLNNRMRIRKGMLLPDLARYVGERLKSVGATVSAVTMDERALTLQDLGGANRVAIFVVRMYSSPLEVADIHALVAKSIDPKTSEIVIIDPNFPLKAQEAGQLTFAPDRKFIKLNLPKSPYGHWVYDWQARTKTFVPYDLRIVSALRIDFPAGFLNRP